MDLGLTDKRALITGASRGLGFAVALGLAREGCRVAINSRNLAGLSAAAERIAVETRRDVLNLPGDVSDPGMPDQIIAATVQEFDGLDILITNSARHPENSNLTIRPGWKDRTFTAQPRAPDPRCTAGPAPVQCGQCVDHHFLFRQTTDSQPGALEQCARCHLGLTKTLALEPKRRHPFQFHLPGWTETERG
jgi:3-oxoacyl-[acyl-carrier protein] reductase